MMMQQARNRNRNIPTPWFQRSSISQIETDDCDAQN
jgi:hypothetical protein